MNEEPKIGEWWMCEVYHNETPYSQVLYFQGGEYSPWQPKMNLRFKHKNFVKTVNPKFKIEKAK